MPADDFGTLERSLLGELARLDGQIADLQRQREATNRLLFTVRKREIGHVEVNRQNSIPRVMAERAILEHLGRPATGSMASGQLFIQVQRTIPDVGRSTFASYLKRMHERGLIVSPRHGRWQIAAAGRALLERRSHDRDSD